MEDAAVAGLSRQELAARITELAGHLNAATHRWLVLIAEFDRRKGWSDGYTKSCAHWLNWKCGIDLGAAREKLRVARALEGLPQICRAAQTAARRDNRQRSRLDVCGQEIDQFAHSRNKAAPAREHRITMPLAWSRDGPQSRLAVRAATASTDSYPAPIVDHAAARDRALAAYRAARAG
jgi:hypothetical protein